MVRGLPASCGRREAGVSEELEPVEVWLDRVKGLEGRHELLQAFDMARRGLEQHPDALWLKHRTVLCLLRLGAVRSARALLRTYRLEGRPEEDVAVLPARLMKEEALEATGAARRALCREAAALYEAVFRRPGGTYYPGINAATLRLLAGDPAAARDLAAEVLRRLDRADAAADPYYHPATRAEALLILGERAGAAAAIADAAAASADRAARAVTRRQLLLLCRELGQDPSLLDPLAPPAVIHYAGHMIVPAGHAGRFPAAAEPEVARRVAEALEELGVGYGYGSLACGADILFAEALLARGAELTVVLPFAEADFERQSVERGGPGWVERFRACLRRASHVVHATPDPYLGQDTVYTFASVLAMGLALLQARALDAPVSQVVVSDGRPASGVAGTARDLESWRATALPIREIRVAAATEGTPAPQPARPTLALPPRIPRAMLFGDVEGFTRLAEAQIPAFATAVLGTIAEVVDRHGRHVLHRNTWGDGLYLVLDAAAPAAACALELQERLTRLDAEAHGLPPIGLRLAGHCGLVYEVIDPVTRQLVFMGSQVSRTARIEPITPAGEVYVTDAFAACVALSAGQTFRCDYVGHQPAAKGWGRMPMYLLRRSSAAPEPAR